MRSEPFDHKRIKKLIPTEIAELRIYGETDSTNTRARHHVLEGGAAPAVFLADSQTAGRGRTGKSFYSPAGTGLYLSLLLPRSQKGDILFMTSAAAVAVRRAILRATGIETGIKWVNDLYIGEKKVAGILCEAMTVGERGYVIIGVGINLSTRDFPDGLESVAGSLGLGVGDRNIRDLLAAECVGELCGAWQSGFSPELLREYRECSVVLGKEIRYIENGVTREGIAMDIDDKGRLYVRERNGDVRALDSGEITVRFK